MFLHKLRLFLGWLVQLCILLLKVAVAASVWLLSGWCTTLVAGVADCYFAQGLPWLIPVMPHEASHSSFIDVAAGFPKRIRSFLKGSLSPQAPGEFALLSWNGDSPASTWGPACQGQAGV